jgi:hypothetical protein
LLVGGLPRCSGVTATNTGPTVIQGCPAGSLPEGGSGDDSDDGGPTGCTASDSDGVLGGCYEFDVTVDDTGFSPRVLKAQNLAQIILDLKNTGTRPHDFTLGCVATDYPGCPSQVCFPAQSHVPGLAPGASARVTFTVPYIEGIYDFRSDVAADSSRAGDGGLSGLWGQFVVQ